MDESIDKDTVDARRPCLAHKKKIDDACKKSLEKIKTGHKKSLEKVAIRCMLCENRKKRGGNFDAEAKNRRTVN